MDKNLKKCYICLDLPYSANIEEVELRKNALVKIEKSKENIEQVQIIENSATIIIENIKKNGIPKDNHQYEANNESIVKLIIIFIFCAVACLLSFFIF